MSTIPESADFRVIPLHLIDPPELAVREQFDEQRLMELADDIHSNGLIQPLVVRSVGDRFEIIAGHRRYTALHMIGAVSAPCSVRNDTDIDPDALKIAENAEREDVNPAHEAQFFARLLARDPNGDTDALAKKVRRSREYVETRLLLLRGDTRIYAAVAAGTITLSVARELNAIRNEGQRLVYLEAAVRGGASAKVAQQWRKEANRFADIQVESAEAAGAPAPMPTQPVDSVFRCICCDGDEDTYDMRLVYVHNGCYRTVLRHIIEGVRPVRA